MEISPGNAFTELIRIDEPFELTDLYTEIRDLENRGSTGLL